MGATPSKPQYDTTLAQQGQDRVRNEAQKTQYVNYNSALGGYTWNPETSTIDVNSNLQDRSRLALINSGLADINLNATEAAEKYFQNTMDNLQPQIDKYRSQVSADLINKGIPIGSRAYNQVQEEMDKNISQQIENAYVDARSRALSETGAQINNIGGMQSQIYQPQVYAGIGATGLSNTYDNKFQNEMDIYNAQMASRNSGLGAGLGAIGTIGGGILGAYFGGPAGAMAGSSIGGSVGNAVGQNV